jgi:hypothetical protein
MHQHGSETITAIWQLEIQNSRLRLNLNKTYQKKEGGSVNNVAILTCDSVVKRKYLCSDLTSSYRKLEKQNAKYVKGAIVSINLNSRLWHWIQCVLSTTQALGGFPDR